MIYKTFTRTWWKHNQGYPGGLEPCPGRKYHYESYGTEAEARKACKAWNDTHNPGLLSRKMEYESASK